MLLLSACPTNALALDIKENFNDELILQYTYATNVKSYISILSKEAKCTSRVAGIVGVTTKIVITQRLQKKNGDIWTNVQSWTKTVNGYNALFVNKKALLTSGTYRTRTIAKIYKGSAYETIKNNSSTIIY